MGASATRQLLTEDLLEEYAALGYLSKGEICHLMKKFYSIDPEKVDKNYSHRFSRREIVDKFEVLKNNPFQDRLFRVFSSRNDDRFSFEDLLDLCSAMSADCPPHVKAAWAFRIFDIDEDNQINANDICKILDRLTWDSKHRHHCLDREAKLKIANIILEEIKLDFTGGIGLSEFIFILSRIPEFSSSFYFRI